MMVIPDGDRRYAKINNITKRNAYKKAVLVVREMVDWILIGHGINEFTFFGLSYNNITKRTYADLNSILEVQTEALESCIADNLFSDNGIRVCIYGQMHMLPKEYVGAVKKVESVTAKYSNKRFNLLLGYSGKLDMEQALGKALRKKKKPTLDDVLHECQMRTPIDFALRTANENRISDGPFFLTQYTEFHSITPYFPDIMKKDIDGAIKTYAKRRRTFGA